MPFPRTDIGQTGNAGKPYMTNNFNRIEEIKKRVIDARKKSCNPSLWEDMDWLITQVETLREGLRKLQYARNKKSKVDERDFCRGCGTYISKKCEPDCWLAKLLEGK